MAKIAEPFIIEVEHMDGVFFAGCAYRVGAGRQRVRLGTGISATEAVSGLLAAFRRNGHAGKRFETDGVQPPLQGSVPGWRKRAARDIEAELPRVAM